MPSFDSLPLAVVEPALALLASALRALLEGLSLGAVLLGLLVTLRQAGSVWRRRLRGPQGLAGVRLTFGSWLALALEFQLGADIVATSTSPTGTHLVQLAVVAVIRTLLNVFLARDLEQEKAQQVPAAEGRP